MEKIEAIIKPFELDELKRASGVGFVSVTVSEVHDAGRRNGQTEMHRGRRDVLPKLKVEVVVPDERADAVVSLICGIGKTGSIGDGRVFVWSLRDVIGCGLGEHGERTIGEDPEPVHRRPGLPGLPVDVDKGTAIARAPDSEGNDAETIMGVALRSLADYLVAHRPGKVHREIVAIVERSLFAHVLALTDGNQLRAAHLLGVNRNTFHSRCRQYGLLSSARTARLQRDPQRQSSEHSAVSGENAGGGTG